MESKLCPGSPLDEGASLVMWLQMEMETKLGDILAQVRELNVKVGFMEKRITNFEENTRTQHQKAGGVFSVLSSTANLHESVVGGGGGPTVKKKTTLSKSLHHFLAQKVTTIAGLHEAVHTENRWMRIVWSMLVMVGIGATFFCLAKTADEFMDNPTATSVQLESETDHEFPPMLLCPEAWFDAEKALALGMTIEMLKYSLSYPDDPYRYQVSNVTRTRQEFHDLYKQNKFESLLDFYDAISPDFVVELEGPNRTYTVESTYACPECISNGKLGKTMLDNRLCHILYLKPIEKGFGMYAGVRAMRIKYKARTMGIAEDSPDWYMYFPTYKDSFISMYPKVTVHTYVHNWVRFNMQRFKSLNKPESPCQEARVGSNYSAVTCMADCHNQLYVQRLKCHLLWLSNASSKLQPWDYCNFMDQMPPENWILSEFFASDQNRRIDAMAADVCVKKCPRECDREIFETTLQLQATFTDTERKSWLMNRGDDPNVSAIDLFVKHGAVYQGGVMTFSEMSTYTFIQLINNIGGTLGLFVGGTIMTFAQIILFLIDYYFSKKVRERAAASTKVQELTRSGMRIA